MNVREIPLVFDCQGSELIGMLHVPQTIRSRGMISMVAGGPQYRAGVGRLQVQMARELAAGGVPVMRFDHRGLGDSEGRFRGFEDVQADLAAAINTFQQQVPELKEFVLWGGCDAAAAIFINARKFPEVTGMVAGNPWVHTEQSGDAVVMKHHYAKRIREKAFWLKVLRLQYSPWSALALISRSMRAGFVGRRKGSGSQSETGIEDDPSLHFVQRMRKGIALFKGDLLLLMSGRSLLTKEFDELLAGSPDWQLAMRAPRQMRRHDLPEADQTFSAMSVRAEVNQVVLSWMLDPLAQFDPGERAAP